MATRVLSAGKRRFIFVEPTYFKHNREYPDQALGPILIKEEGQTGHDPLKTFGLQARNFRVNYDPDLPEKHVWVETSDELILEDDPILSRQ